MSLKAFAVTEEYDNTGAIIFAARDIEARKWGANEFNDGELRGISCRRASWADEFAGNPIPARVMIENGWHFECCGCGATIDEDWLHDHDLPLAGVIGYQHSKIYCCEICECRDKLNDAIKRDHERRAIEALKAFVLKRFPAVTLGTEDNNKPHAYASERKGTWQVADVVVSFEFPGMKIAPATCRIDRGQNNLIGPIWPCFWCCFGDREAFEAWLSSPHDKSTRHQASARTKERRAHCA